MSAGANELLITKTDDTTVTISSLTTIADSSVYTGQVAKNLVKSIVIGTDITSIGNDTFKDCTELLTATIGNKVTTIGSAGFSGCSKLTTVTFTATSTLATIGANAFQSCGELTGITIPNSVTTINANTFNACNKLETAIIGTGVTSIAVDAFTNAGSSAANTLQAIITSSSQLSTLGLSYGTGKAFFGASNIKIYSQLAKTLIITNTNSGTADEVVTGLTTIASNSYTTAVGNIKTISIGPEITQISANAFQGCTGLTTVNFAITNTLATIQGFAFISCGELTGIAIPNSVTFIGANAFNNCAKLASVSLPSSNSSFTTLSDQVFRSCAKLTSITIPASVTTIGNSAFLDAGLTSVTIPNTVTSLGTGVFKNTDLQSMTIGSGISALPANTFNDCTALQSVTIPSTITSIGNNAFNGCTNASFTSLTIHTAITSIGTSAFKSCTGLQTLTFTATSTLTTIDVDAFFNCTALTSVSIPDSVTSLATGVFNGCTSLDTVVIGSELTSIGADTFNGCTKLRRTTVGDKVASIAANAFTSAGSALASGTVLQVKMSATPLTALNLSYSVGVAFRGATNVTIVAEFVIPAPLPPDASCFPGNTPVQTDQGIVNICDLCPDKHTIRGNKIETVTQNTGIEDFLILIKKDTLYPNVPSQDTYITFDHNIFVNKQNVRAGVLETRAQESGIPDLMNRIYQVPYNGEVLYNVLLKHEKHDYMCVNNLIVETMSPKNIFAKYYCYLKNKKQGEKNSELEEAYKKYSSMTRTLVKKHQRSRLTKK